jgi:hypothetical protein
MHTRWKRVSSKQMLPEVDSPWQERSFKPGHQPINSRFQHNSHYAGKGKDILPFRMLLIGLPDRIYLISAELEEPLPKLS